jgi:hypothetical protein
VTSAVDNRHSNPAPKAANSKLPASGNSKAPPASAAETLVPAAEKTLAPAAEKAPASNAEKTHGSGSPISAHSNPVAHEVQVIVAGARPCKAGGKRELFTEETTSVLVFERGGVLRLAAAVAAGQLLFLTNKETKREVVAQVARKRDFKPMNCFCEVEFTEPAPGFWGFEFPEVPFEYVLSNSQQEKVAEQVQSAKPVVAKPKVQTPVPSAEEVLELKQQVEALREQLKSLQAQTIVEKPTAAPSAIPSYSDSSHSVALVSVTAPVAEPSSSSQNLPGATSGVTPQLPPACNELSPQIPSATSEVPQKVSKDISEIPATATSQGFAALPRERGGPSFSDESHLQTPVIRINRANSSKRSAKSKEITGINLRAGVLRKALLLASLLLAAVGVAWYQNLIPGLPPLKNGFSSVPHTVARNVVARPAPAASTAPPRTAATPLDSLKIAPVVNDAAPSPIAASQDAAKTVTATEAKPSIIIASEVPGRSDEVSAALREKSTIANPVAKRSAVRAMSNAALVSTVSPLDGVTVVPPKLVKSVLAVAAPEALQDFATGDVTLDALVDSSGRVKAMKILSGPAALRRASLDALKQYRYEPATLRGKPVAAHVTVTIKFLFEP